MNGIEMIARTLKHRTCKAPKKQKARRINPQKLASQRRILREVQMARDGVRITAGLLMVSFGLSRSSAKRDLRLLREFGFC